MRASSLASKGSIELVWSSRGEPSLEHCVLEIGRAATAFDSTVVGVRDRAPFTLRYRLLVDARWRAKRVDLSLLRGRESWNVELVRAARHWTIDGVAAPALDGCTDVDITLTPSTNTLPIRRLAWRGRRPRRVRVAYIDPLAHSIEPAIQHYARVSSTSYAFATADHDFEARIEVDESGLVVDYPPLFTRLPKARAPRAGTRRAVRA